MKECYYELVCFDAFCVSVPVFVYPDCPVCKGVVVVGTMR